MKIRRAFLIVFLVFIISVPIIADNDGFVGANLLQDNPQVTTYRSGDRGVPVYVEGILSEASVKGTEIQTSMAFFEINKGAYRMADPNSELSYLKSKTDRYGFRHLFFEQKYQNLPVIGHMLRVHFKPDGVIKTVEGHYLPEINIDPIASINSSEALSIAENDLGSFFGSGEPSIPELVIFNWNDENHLCYQIWIISNTPMGRWEYFIDANSGDLIFKANRIMDDDDIGTGTGVMGASRNHIDTDFNGSSYRMYDDTRQLNNDAHGHGGQMAPGQYIQTNIAGSSLPGSIATDADNVWDNTSVQAPAVDGHVYSALMYDWMLSEFNRNSFDDAGATMLTSVNYYAEGTNNAYWNGSQIVIWDWSTDWRSLAGCPDVIAHEWGHAVTEYGSNLVYQLESGALNESFSDMIGTAFEFAHDSMDVPDWEIGENGRYTGLGFRSMSDPHSHSDPDYYGTSDPYWIDVVGCSPSNYNDWCGVHTNSGVGNKWFYLLSEGGIHSGVNVTGIGIENAILIAYQANEYYWGALTNYHEAALGTISAANDLDLSGIWTAQVANAWNAVGVSTPGPSIAFTYPTGIPTMISPNSPTSFEVVFNPVLGGEPLAGSGNMYYTVNDGVQLDGSMIHTGNNHYDITLPALECNSVIKFFIRGRESSSGYVFDPADTTNPYSVIVASGLSTIFADDFETDQGWTVSGNASDGHWDRSVPVGGGDRGDPANDFDGSGNCYLTDNLEEHITDNSDVDGGTTWLTSPVFDLSEGDAKISYARWYSNSNGADPNNDLFKVFISNDNGSSWVIAETVGPSYQSNGGWYEHSFMVSDFVTPTAIMKVRFEVSDLNDGSVVEAGIDAFSVERYECGSVTPQVIIITDNLPDWTEGVTYSQQLEVVDETGLLNWTDLNDELIGTGLSLSLSGLISGSPTNAGTVSFTASVTDEVPSSDEMLYTFNINSAVLITTTNLAEGTETEPYSEQLAHTGGTGTVTYTDKNNVLSGTGLTLSSDGLLSGTPLDNVVLNLTVRAEDAVGGFEEKLFIVTINRNYICGDIDNNGLDPGISDLTFMVDFLFNSGPAPPIQDAADVNGDGTLGISDITYFVDYLFGGGEPPTCP